MGTPDAYSNVLQLPAPFSQVQAPDTGQRDSANEERMERPEREGRAIAIGQEPVRHKQEGTIA